MEEDTPKIRDTTGTIFIQGTSIVLPVWRCIMFNNSYLRACMKLRIVQKLDFPFLSLGRPRHGARVWCLGRVPKHRNQWQEVEGLLFSPQNYLVSRPSAKAKEPLARSRGQWQEVGGLLFSPKNSQLVHILSFHSYLRSCMNLRIVQKIRFSLHESGWTKAWCPGLVSRPSAKT